MSGFLFSPSKEVSSEASAEGLGRRLQVKRSLNESMAGWLAGWPVSMTAAAFRECNVLVVLQVWNRKGRFPLKAR